MGLQPRWKKNTDQIISRQKMFQEQGGSNYPSGPFMANNNYPQQGYSQQPNTNQNTNGYSMDFGQFSSTPMGHMATSIGSNLFIGGARDAAVQVGRSPSHMTSHDHTAEI